jgi:hypothetical protein
MRGSAWRLYLGAGALATGVYHLLPVGPQAVLNLLVGASAVAAIALGVRWHRPARRLAWWLIAAAQGLFVAGDALFSVNELVLHIEPFPSLADALYLPGYPVLAAGLAVVALSRSTGRDWAGLADAAIIAIGFGLLSWVLVMVPYFRDPSLGIVELLVSLAYPGRRRAPAGPGGPPGHHTGPAHGRLPAADRQPGRDHGRRHAVLGPRPQRRLDGCHRYQLPGHLPAGEALTNVARHASADRLWLELEGAGDQVDLEIRDDGVGFEPQASSTLVRDGHFGLVAMQERVEMAGGRFQVDSHPGAGAVVRAMFRVTAPA